MTETRLKRPLINVFSFLLYVLRTVTEKIVVIPDEMESEDSESDDNAPTVLVNGKAVPITSVDDDVIAQMSPTEKETYIQVYQEYYSHIYD